MRVLVELFDKDPISNILGTCIFEPEIVVFLCDRRDERFVKENAVYRLLRHRRMKTKPRFYYLDTRNLLQIRRVLAAVLRDYPDCCFEYSGGQDLLLLEAGSFCIPRGVPGFYIDPYKGKILNIQGCENLVNDFTMPEFAAEEIFTLTGAAIHGSGHFSDGELNEAFEEDILKTWEVVMRNPKAWGAFVTWLQAACAGTPITMLEVSAKKVSSEKTGLVRYNHAVLELLYKNRVLTLYSTSKNEVRIRFKSSLHKKCLLNQGIWLELYGYVIAKRANFFNDVRTSVLIDWDGVKGGLENTKNEVDIFLVKGVTPVFISCKMGVPSPLALSEIKLLSVKFGGSVSKAVVLTGSDLGNENKALQTRADDLDILLLDKNSLQAEILTEKLKELVEGS